MFVVSSSTPCLLSAVKKTYSGKVGGRNDDIAIAFQLALAGCRVFYSSEKYQSFRIEL